ncbi:hypothetical protein D0869_12527 [Hortaea werneckii]|uniref:Uncharacterized protein n=1 Tax=Hortaea werneckii TaxID=91943 RepID=A0A3M6W7E2_HORWE|nr:hypothetical protein KC334_g7103 [Hortaea werneckii]KAI6965062.1 hypothetical protein KC355_g12278 [Hortaea werneckii]KAI7191796.1 hypothetical protein KC324_g5628 [Hortaea werneckii]KAI7586524.1 hypothetical protein KC316_g5552 [Hortaea werneckii]KAI7661983.1 hypothetical protein KC318_g9129 [Hortaea werneckii]
MANDKDNKTFTFETVATVVAALQSQGKTLGNREYELMAALDGTRSASSFEHSFRAVKKRAQEISQKGGSKNGGKASTEKPTPRKRAKAGSTCGVLHASKGSANGCGKSKGDSEGSNEESDESPAKKVKQEDKSGGNTFFSEALGDLA